MKNKKSANTDDLQDSEKDKQSLQPEETTIDLPDVEDIPGQENIKVPPLGELADTTISSDDEEGIGIFDDEDNTTNVSKSERVLLHTSANKSPGDEDEKNIRAIALDRTDNEGNPLNEGNLITDHFGEDLDLPESEEVDEEDIPE